LRFIPAAFLCVSGDGRIPLAFSCSNRPKMEGMSIFPCGWVTLTAYDAIHAPLPHCPGEGHVYQGRFQSFPFRSDSHFIPQFLCRYVERNAPACQTGRAREQWRWGSLFRWCSSRVNLCQAICVPNGRWPFGQTGFAVSTKRAATTRRLDAVRWVDPAWRPVWTRKTSGWQSASRRRLDLDLTLR